jgi:large subunit ribosomal protein L35
MPKIKTNKGAKKRFFITAKGKIKRKRAFASHILTKKEPQRKRKLRSATFVHHTDRRRIKSLLPYG